MNKRIVITGAHHNAALAVATLLKDNGWEIIWLGHKFTMRGDKKVSAEYKEVTAAGIKFINLKAGKINPKPELANIAKIPLGFIQSMKLLIRIKPHAVLTFGGYLSLPVVICARLMGIPIFVHEQTSIAGRANKLASRFASKIFLTWYSSAKLFPRNKSVLTGLPLNPHLLRAEKTKLFDELLPLILIMGGKQGSHSLNMTIFSQLEQLLSTYNLVHITGSSSITGDYEKALELKKGLSPKLAQRYKPYDYLESEKIAPVLASADLVVSRAGAHTVYELAYLNKPAILVPYPYAPSDEQGQNAKILESLNLATVIREPYLTPELLSATISKMLKKGKPKKKVPVPADATKKIVSTIESEVQ